MRGDRPTSFGVRSSVVLCHRLREWARVDYIAFADPVSEFSDLAVYRFSRRAQARRIGCSRDSVVGSGDKLLAGFEVAFQYFCDDLVISVSELRLREPEIVD